MSNPYNAKLWIGTEAEYEDGETKKLFVDGASSNEIEEALGDHPEVGEVYFAHDFRWSTIRSLENKVEVTIEVTMKELMQHPATENGDLLGMVNVILRVPEWVNAAKIRTGNCIQVARLEPETSPTVAWGGQKVYPKDEIILEKDRGDEPEETVL